MRNRGGGGLSPSLKLLAALALALGPGPLNASGGKALIGGDVVFAFMVNKGHQEIEAVILAQSIRDFGGTMSQNRVWAMVPLSVQDVSAGTRRQLENMGVSVMAFQIDEQPLRFPLAAKVYAAAEAESLAGSEASVLAWLDSDNIVIREPKAFVLPPGKVLGYRPVMLKNISSMYDRPVDGFWKLVYDGCGTTPDRIFPMTATVDRAKIRAHFNAGLLLVRPERGLLRAWRANFEKLYRQEAFRPYYDQNPLYAAFFHQAALAGTVLSLLIKSDLVEIPEEYNYPLMLRERIDFGKRSGLEGHLVTLRYDEYRPNPEWLDSVDLGKRYVPWLEKWFRPQ
jgi:hypothetical protein